MEHLIQEEFQEFENFILFEESKEDFSWMPASLEEIPEFSPHNLLVGFGRALLAIFPKRNYINKIQYHFSQYQVVFPIKSTLVITSTVLPLLLN